jgi:hypothetical protein
MGIYSHGLQCDVKSQLPVLVGATPNLTIPNTFD